MNRRELALEQLHTGQLLEAQSNCRQVLLSDPDDAEAMHILARTHLAAGQLSQAVEWASQAIRKSPKPVYLTTLGAALSQLGRLDEALQVFDKAVQLEPDDAALWCELGKRLVEAARASDALLCFQHALALDPAHAEATYQTGHLLHGLGRFDEALALLDRSAELQQDPAPTFAMRGLVLAKLKRFEEAVGDYERAIRLDPDDVDACANLGTALRALGQPEAALSWYDRSLAIAPTIAGATNRAMTLTELGRFDEAAAAFRQAEAIEPDHPMLVWNFALLKLWLGDFEDGWRGREARWSNPAIASAYPRLDTPMWLGREDVAGKTVVVCQDEGMGDAIQFARYIPMLAARGAKIILVVDEPLCPLLSKLDGVSHCLPKQQGLVVPPFDFHVAIDSLPLVFDTRLETIPAPRAYLPPPDADRVRVWEQRLGPRDRLRVGLVWAGNPKHSNDRNRSVPLALLSEMLDVDATFVSLQKQPPPQDVAMLRELTGIVDHTAHLTDFAETAALASCLDLVITVDTSVAHLAAALGRPTWIMLPYVADWRWLLGRDDSPWYPTVRLFRQDATRDHARVVDRMRTELMALVARERG
jgi:tetratricopeptide (TPR) repeat protein